MRNARIFQEFVVVKKSRPCRNGRSASILQKTSVSIDGCLTTWPSVHHTQRPKSHDHGQHYKHNERDQSS
jgi:hypothetical protein